MYTIKYFVLYLIYLQILETVDYLVKNSYADYIQYFLYATIDIANNACKESPDFNYYEIYTVV